ncbi:MAG: hypothetical protein EXR75_04395 [Myxococcales bacterium]|nr:hypothetical protein [Myxococcales bacterium]
MYARRAIAVALSLLAPAVTGCGYRGLADKVIPHGGHDPTPLARCTVAQSHEQPLVTEWPAPYKARLEAMLQDGAVAVDYSGCELRIIDGCKVPGSYKWNKTTLSRDTTDIRNEDELFAKLPVGALALSGELKAAGSLQVQTTVTGQLRLVGGATRDATLGAECPGATHLVTALSIGAFKLMAGGSVSGEAGVALPGAGLKGATRESTSILREAGDPASCARATKEHPSPDCRSPIQIFLLPIQRSIPLNVLSPIPDEPG